MDAAVSPVDATNVAASTGDGHESGSSHRLASEWHS
jgi:hypothetical protein